RWCNPMTSHGGFCGKRASTSTSCRDSPQALEQLSTRREVSILPAFARLSPVERVLYAKQQASSLLSTLREFDHQRCGPGWLQQEVIVRKCQDHPARTIATDNLRDTHSGAVVSTGSTDCSFPR